MAMQEAGKYGFSLAENYYNPEPYQGDVNFPEYSLNKPTSTGYPIMPKPEQYQAPEPKLGGFNFPDAGAAALSAGGGFVQQESQARSALASADYQRELAALQQKKYWWDPNYDVRPELEEYMEDVPSARDKLIDSTLTGGKMGGGAAEFAHHKGGQRALQGASIGAMVGGWGAPIGAVVGGVVGLIEGFFTWGEAKDKDKEVRRKQRRQYERDLKKWKAQREKLVADRNRQLRQLQIQGTIGRAQQKEAEERQEEADTMYRRHQKRLQMIATLKNAAQMQQQYHQQLASLSRHLQPLGA